MILEHTLEILSPTTGEHIEVTVNIEFDAWYQAAHTSGPPEDCYPEDSEIDFTDFKYKVPEGLTSELIDTALEENMDMIEEEAWEHYHSAKYEGE